MVRPFAFAVLLSAAVLAAAPARAALTAVPTAVDFGAVDASVAAAPATVTFTNGGAAPVTIDDVYMGSTLLPQGNDFAVTPQYAPPFPLASGASFTVSIEYLPTSVVPGTSFSDYVGVSVDGLMDSATVYVEAVVLDGDLTVTPTLTDFGTVTLGDDVAPRSVVFSNDSNGVVQIAESIEDDPYSAYLFAFSPDPVPSVLNPGESFEVSADFILAVQAGTVTDYVAQFTALYSLGGLGDRTATATFSTAIEDGGGGGGGDDTDTGSNDEGAFIGPCFLDALR